MQVARLLWILPFLWSISVAETRPPKELATVEFSDGLKAEVRVLDAGTLLDPVTFEIRLSLDPGKYKAGATGQSVHIQSLAIEPGPALGQAFWMVAESKGAGCRFANLDVTLAEPVSRICILAPENNLAAMKRVFLVKPGAQPFVLKVERFQIEAQERTVFVDQSIAYSTIVVAGIIGAFLFALLELAIDASKRDVSQWGGLSDLCKRWFLNGRRVLLSSIAGAIVALIVLAITRSNSTAGLPISVNVDTVWGGILVGLSSLPLGRMLRDRLSDSAPTKKESDPSKGK